MKPEQIAELRKLLENATEPPWAYELVGDKCNDWCIGVLVDANDQPIAGEAVQPFNEETGEYGERPIVVDGICEASDNIPNAILITSLVNAAPSLLALASFAIEAREFLREHGEFVSDLCDSVDCPRARCVAMRRLRESARTLDGGKAGR